MGREKPAKFSLLLLILFDWKDATGSRKQEEGVREGLFCSKVNVALNIPPASFEVSLLSFFSPSSLVPSLRLSVDSSVSHTPQSSLSPSSHLFSSLSSADTCGCVCLLSAFSFLPLCSSGCVWLRKNTLPQLAVCSLFTQNTHSHELMLGID